MRWSLLSALLVAAGAGVGWSNGFAGDASCTAAPACGCESACDSGCCQGGCGGGKCHGCGCSRGYEGLDRHFNCGCNGSYKFPVPPLYTYHWPGMYSQQLMTDYHSPWRYPPLKPFSDEHLRPFSPGGAAPAGSESDESLPPAPPTMAKDNSAPAASGVQAAEYASSTNVILGNAESMSEKLKRSSRYAQ